jgi:CheY-like chemotaxis protein
MATDDKKHLLVINDTPAILQVFKELFEDEGFRVTLDTFSSFDSGTKYRDIKTLCPDVIILDFLFGGEPLGWQLLQLLRMDPTTRDIPVVICTAAVKQAEELGAHLLKMRTEVVIKPFDIEDAIAAVYRVMENAGSTMPVQAEQDASEKPETERTPATHQAKEQ